MFSLWAVRFFWSTFFIILIKFSVDIYRNFSLPVKVRIMISKVFLRLNDLNDEREPFEDRQVVASAFFVLKQ